MQNNIDRAVQFQPFDALSGFREALHQVERIVENKKELSDDYFRELDLKLANLHRGSKVKISYYYNLEYVETIGTIKRIDPTYRRIYLDNSIIILDDVIDIEMNPDI